MRDLNQARFLPDFAFNEQMRAAALWRSILPEPSGILDASDIGAIASLMCPRAAMGLAQDARSWLDHDSGWEEGSEFDWELGDFRPFPYCRHPWCLATADLVSLLIEFESWATEVIEANYDQVNAAADRRWIAIRRLQREMDVNSPEDLPLVVRRWNMIVQTRIRQAFDELEPEPEPEPKRGRPRKVSLPPH